uniref:C2 domain-containing protein n=1 Tax=Aureoumbra lagunensis TaxID=44058 RepID=A0A7S3JZ34_9STRA|mmetsp:Transcript_11854/g.16070  ORF Transcript_11854/g.16070 Transcript_11854/m.16070 type:complete len:351 (-) Transcript_11854:809-1861(-)|eukprot:CAMPEP_0197288474 /NCGR_PEP_ID=MMETSP0890-20130614/5557_1 /TAXON_ID=44058 ORGANISM="Aureoumbra lagunensis, Strain CCMP1510" /NCGR_SAMPLE_ID=MMETSP0890 /ASSEMBLY_ACC=CAM_ASM_000533 /LENGTH=350 /DNA_ID=CAMNT_0042759223 /DNA_START=1 /DNA_END=1053 /DNA_ORIENTATION=+
MAGQVPKKLVISNIECHGLRNADFLTKNDPYVVFKIGNVKKVKTRYKSGAGRDVVFPDKLEIAMISDAELEAGIDVNAWDYDVGPDPDDLLGVGKLSNLEELKKIPGQPRHFETVLMYKGRNRGTCSCVLTLSYPNGGGPKPAQNKPLGAVGGQIFNQAMNSGGQPVVAQVAPQPPTAPQHHVGSVQAVVTPQQQAEFMLVTCPANARGGSQVVVQAPSGERLTVLIPQGVQPGGQFRVPLPKPQVHPQIVQSHPQIHQPPTYHQTGMPQAVGTAVDIDGDGRPDYYVPHAAAHGPPPPAYGAPPPQYSQAPQYAYGQPPQYAQPQYHPAQAHQYSAPPPQYGAPPPNYY